MLHHSQAKISCKYQNGEKQNTFEKQVDSCNYIKSSSGIPRVITFIIHGLFASVFIIVSMGVVDKGVCASLAGGKKFGIGGTGGSAMGTLSDTFVGCL